MPTKENMELMERVFAAATQWVEVQKQLERVDQEVNAHKARLGIALTTPSSFISNANAGGGSGGTTKNEGDASGSTTAGGNAPGTAEAKADVLRSSSVSSNLSLFMTPNNQQFFLNAA